MLCQFIRRVSKIAKSGNLLRRVCLFVRPSVCPRGTTRHLLGKFSRNLTKIVEKIQVSLKSDENSGYIA